MPSSRRRVLLDPIILREEPLRLAKKVPMTSGTVRPMYSATPLSWSRVAWSWASEAEAVCFS